MISKSLLQVRQRQCIDCKCVWSQYVIFRTNTSCSKRSNVSFAEFCCLVCFEVQTGVKPHGWWKPRYSMLFLSLNAIELHPRFGSGIIYASGTWNKSVSPPWFFKYMQWISFLYVCVCVCVANVYCLKWNGETPRREMSVMVWISYCWHTCVNVSLTEAFSLTHLQ